MTELKLAKLPDRAPVKIAISISPDLNRSLHAYAELYRETYGDAKSIPELIPYMLEAFLKTDHGFARARKEGSLSDKPAPSVTSRRGRRRRAESGAPSPTLIEGQ